MPQLIKEFTFRADFGKIHNVGVGPLGDRVVITVRGGRFRGDRLNGSIVRASADWLLQGTDEYGRIDARFTLRTTDGAAIYMQFLGLVENTAPVRTFRTTASRPSTATCTSSSLRALRLGTSGTHGSTGLFSWDRDVSCVALPSSSAFIGWPTRS